MGKLEYLEALKRAMLGLPPDVQAKTLAYYEQRFVDGVAAGRGEPDVARELDDPTRIAMTLRASAHLEAFTEKKNPANGFAEKRNPANVLRVAVSAVGLAIFNLFMIVPAMVYSALLFALYVCALTFYLAGIATTASGLAGANELVLDWPSRFVTIDDDGRGRQMRIEIGSHGINVTQERPQIADPLPPADPDAGADRGSRLERSRAMRSAEALADSTVRISTEMDAESRTTQTLFGFGLVLGGIALFLLSLVITRYTFVGLKRYLQMNRSLLKGS
ncbi:hypothetical protein ASD28_29740 [Massilia sp. Root133]|uniref:DUF1700 domain-containing protein n=1 Tax=unclassified Massilia TaxID=2609279 RepID=UPI0006F7F254|nr:MULTISPECIES: DUF1700 domain-containing protein [unclassified Massilia]KQY08536.1 hypothetical protein ASD28_29740 [Massilia sp. Root133]KQZ49181.1 hypothetical protein ASD92_21170 [Massilia sp. Root1485]